MFDRFIKLDVSNKKQRIKLVEWSAAELFTCITNKVNYRNLWRRRDIELHIAEKNNEVYFDIEVAEYLSDRKVILGHFICNFQPKGIKLKTVYECKNYIKKQIKSWVDQMFL